MTYSEHVDLNDFICSPEIDVEFEINEETKDGILINAKIQKTIDVNDYANLDVEVTLDFHFHDIADEISDEDLLEEAEDRDLIPEINMTEYSSLYFTEEKKEFFTNLFDLNRHSTIEQILERIKNEIT